MCSRTMSLPQLNGEEESAWQWSGRSHINVLETAAVIKLFRKIALDGGDCRLTYFIDSHVAKSALCRGRSASSALRPLLKRACSWCLAFGLYPQTGSLLLGQTLLTIQLVTPPYLLLSHALYGGLWIFAPFHHWLRSTSLEGGLRIGLALSCLPQTLPLTY